MFQPVASAAMMLPSRLPVTAMRERRRRLGDQRGTQEAGSRRNRSGRGPSGVAAPTVDSRWPDYRRGGAFAASWSRCSGSVDGGGAAAGAAARREGEGECGRVVTLPLRRRQLAGIAATLRAAGRRRPC
ncbi:MAG: hypothetical protein ACK52I_15055, partial [Pseudomonadota bacterium]